MRWTCLKSIQNQRFLFVFSRIGPLTKNPKTIFGPLMSSRRDGSIRGIRRLLSLISKKIHFFETGCPTNPENPEDPENPENLENVLK